MPTSCFYQGAATQSGIELHIRLKLNDADGCHLHIASVCQFKLLCQPMGVALCFQGIGSYGIGLHSKTSVQDKRREAHLHQAQVVVV